MAWFQELKKYCVVLDHNVTSTSVCKRRVLPVMEPAWPQCAGCDYKETLEAEQPGDAYSEPPKFWFNLPFYRLTLGEEACRVNRPGRVRLEPLKLQLRTAVHDYAGKGRVDITVKSGNPAFAPSWEMVHGVKDGSLEWAVYTEQYLALMRQSYADNRAEWMKLIAMGDVVVTCYCRPHSNCHRYLFAEIVEKICSALEVEYEYGGEVFLE